MRIVAHSPTFDWTCQELENESDLDRLEARGTIRICLKNSGLDASSVSPDQMKVVIEKVLPSELISRGVEGAEKVCEQMAARVSSIEAGGVTESPEEIFRRLGGN